MFDTTQQMTTNSIDYRFLPDKGIICLWKLVEYLGISRARKEENLKYVSILVNELERNNVPVLKIGTDSSYWCIRLEDIKAKNEE